MKKLFLLLLIIPSFARADLHVDFIGNKVIVDKDNEHVEILLTKEQMQYEPTEIVRLICDKYLHCKDQQ